MNTGIVSLPEFICKTLKNSRASGFITSRGYRQSKARLHQRLRYRFPVADETEFWKQNPPQAIIKNQGKCPGPKLGTLQNLLEVSHPSRPARYS